MPYVDGEYVMPGGDGMFDPWPLASVDECPDPSCDECLGSRRRRRRRIVGQATALPARLAKAEAKAEAEVGAKETEGDGRDGGAGAPDADAAEDGEGKVAASGGPLSTVEGQSGRMAHERQEAVDDEQRRKRGREQAETQSGPCASTETSETSYAAAVQDDPG